MKNAKISNIQFVFALMVVLIHAATIFINLPGKDLEYIFGENASTFVQIFIGDGICRVAVPSFFVISGYLFFHTFDGTWTGWIEKLKKRVSSLVIPYLFWSLAVFFAFFFAQQIPALSAFFTTRNESVLSLELIVREGLLDSYDSPLWFCRYLIVFALLSLLLYQAVKRVPVLLLAVMFFAWFFGLPFEIPFRTDAVFFYCAGAAIGVHETTIMKWLSALQTNRGAKLSLTITATLAWLLILAMRTTHYCRQDPYMMLNGTYDRFVTMTQNVAILFGMVACWNLYDFLSAPKKQTVWDVTAYSFLIFVSHHPIVNTLKKLLMRQFGFSELTSLAVYFLSAGITVGFIMLVGSLVRRYLPALWRMATGNRV